MSCQLPRYWNEIQQILSIKYLSKVASLKLENVLTIFASWFFFNGICSKRAAAPPAPTPLPTCLISNWKKQRFKKFWFRKMKKKSKSSVYNENRSFPKKIQKIPYGARHLYSCFRNKPWQKKRWHLPVFIYTIHGVEIFGICLRL